MEYFPKITRATPLGDLRVELTFNDGLRKIMNLDPYLQGPLFEPIRERDLFKRMFIESGALTWPGGVDICPHMLYHELPPAWLNEAS